MKYAWLALVIIFLGGCLTRTYVTEKPRVDREIQGNQGYLFGSATEAERQHKVKETRTISVLEIELGSHQARESKSKQTITARTEVPVQEDIEVEENILEEIVPEGKEATLYTVQKGDTLQKISMKFYGTTKKWKKLYDANRDVLKSPDRVYPGKTIRIPTLK